MFELWSTFGQESSRSFCVWISSWDEQLSRKNTSFHTREGPKTQNSLQLLTLKASIILTMHDTFWWLISKIVDLGERFINEVLVLVHYYAFKAYLAQWIYEIKLGSPISRAHDFASDLYEIWVLRTHSTSLNPWSNESERKRQMYNVQNLCDIV